MEHRWKLHCGRNQMNIIRICGVFMVLSLIFMSMTDILTSKI